MRGINGTDLPVVNIAPVFLLPLIKAWAFRKRAWLNALKPSCDAILVGPSWGRAGSQGIAAAPQETAYCEQNRSSISCNVTSAGLATGLTAFVLFIFFCVSIPWMVLMQKGCEHHKSVYFNWLCYPDKLKAERARRLPGLWVGLRLFKYRHLEAAGLISNWARRTWAGLVWHPVCANRLGQRLFPCLCSIQHAADLFRAFECCSSINSTKGRTLLGLFPLRRMAVSSPAPLSWSVLHNEKEKAAKQRDEPVTLW